MGGKPHYIGVEMNANELKELALATDTELARLYSVKFELMATARMYRQTIASRYIDDLTKAEYEIKLDAVLFQIKDVATQIAPLDATFEMHKWNRAFLVQNNNGHVHARMSCSTCLPTTEFAWLVDYAAATETEIVEAAGEEACTVCYPSAPADVLNRPSTIVTADKIAKAAAKAERDAKKAEKIAKRPTVDGSELIVAELWMVRQNKELKTERAAELWYSEAGENLTKEYHTNKWGIEGCAKVRDGMDRVAGALAAKRGVSLEIVLADLNKKVAKRIKNNTY
jgi:hypothetical protein